MDIMKDKAIFNVIFSAIKAGDNDNRVFEIAIYPDGWVANSYKYKSPGRRIVLRKGFGGRWSHVRTETIDRKRSFGRGPKWVCFSDKGGRLVSG